MYTSSRNNKIQITASKAILKGLSDDGGLFIPRDIPIMDIYDKNILEYSYKDFAKKILSLYLDDFTEEEINYCVENAYNNNNFNTEKIAPVKKAGDYYFIELFHGKTLAFKDMALSILPYLMEVSKKKNNIEEDILIMTATSGDTGKAALEAFSDREGVKILVYYPNEGVSDMQEHQMQTQKGDNLFVYAIEGNFDDAQTAVKKAFNSESFKQRAKEKGYLLSSANSINIGRLIPQIVYYFTSYFELVKTGDIELGEKINIVVPTGNFGNILASYYASQMELPVNRLLCASNSNRVLADFFMSMGIYNINRRFYTTISPSMDILISSNFERMIYHASFGNDKYVKEKIEELNRDGIYELSLDVMAEMDIFSGEFINDGRAKLNIHKMFHENNYLIDTHTAVAVGAYRKYNEKRLEKNKVLIASTASPFKFSKAVLDAIKTEKKTNSISGLEKIEKKESVVEKTSFELLRELSEYSGLEIDKNLIDSEFVEPRFNMVIKAEQIEDSVFEFMDRRRK